MDTLFEKQQVLLARTTTVFKRYMYDKVAWESRMAGLVGPRGAGKTTMLLQYIKEKNDSDTLYVSADDIYFSRHRLSDLADVFYKNGGKQLFIDEIHKYKDWSVELKNIYDFHPDLKVFFTGSSVLDVRKGMADLSRRALMYSMQGFSFRDYLCAGYYPMAADENLDIRLGQIINLTLEIDIPQFANLSVATARKLKRLLLVVAENVPFKPNFVTLAAKLEVSRNSLEEYMTFMEDAGLIARLRNRANGVISLGKIDKVYLDNTVLIHCLSERKPEIGNIRETFFLNQMRVNHAPVSSAVADFRIAQYTFEAGGKSKTQEQIKDTPNAFIVKDNIEYGYKNIVPLWAFGLNY